MTIEREGVCAACANPLEGTNWRMVNGRAYHAGCKPLPETPQETKDRTGGLGSFAERKARDVLVGRGQGTLDEVTERRRKRGR
jgi:hypothetical protein